MKLQIPLPLRASRPSVAPTTCPLQCVTTRWLLVGFVCFCFLGHGAAQEAGELDDRAGLLFGVGQLIQGGFNAEATVLYRRFAFDYSHGVSLEIPNGSLEAGADKDQGLEVRIPWTTGFGVGYRFNNWLNLRAEPKWHQFELYYADDTEVASDRIADYTTFTLGLGLYANFRPFGKRDDFLQGITVAPNVRWWPRVSSSLPDDSVEYANAITGRVESHTARDIGIGNTPFFANVSVGYTLAF